MQVNLYQNIFRSVSTQRVAELLNKGQENKAIALLLQDITNKSSSVHDKAIETSTPEHGFKWNFFLPANKNPLIEIIKDEKTSDETIASAHSLATAMGYKPIISQKDSTAYRIVSGVLMEAARMAKEGLASPDVIDNVFLETFYPEQIHVKLTSVKKQFNAALKPAFLKDNHHQEFPKSVNAPLTNSNEARELIADRLKGTYIAIAYQIYLSGLSTPQDIEMACEEGFKYNYGPLKMAQNLGKEEVKRLTTLVNEGLDQSLPTGICKPGTFVEFNDNELSGVQTYTQDGIGYIVMGSSHIQNLRKTDNSLSPEMMKGISTAINKFENDDSIKTIMLRSQGGKVFCAGADLEYVKNRIQFDLEKSKAYMKLGKDLMDQIANCKKTTVAIIDGKMVGGGAEIAAACDYRILTVNATLAMPENALGLDPDWGGSERIPALIGKLLTVPLICNSKGMKWMWLNASEACSVGFGDNKKPISQSDLPMYLANLIEDKIEGLNIHRKPNRKPAFDKPVTEYPDDIVLKFKLNEPYVHKWRLLTRAVARETEKLILNAEDPNYRKNSYVTTNTKELIGRARWVYRLYTAPFIMAVQNKFLAPILEKLGLAK